MSPISFWYLRGKWAMSLETEAFDEEDEDAEELAEAIGGGRETAEGCVLAEGGGN